LIAWDEEVEARAWAELAPFGGADVVCAEPGGLGLSGAPEVGVVDCGVLGGAFLGLLGRGCTMEVLPQFFLGQFPSGKGFLACLWRGR
ncbi:MAG: hypothetical protein QW231_06225, partial [Candidatus Bathyarchaeia archaeon]